MDPGVKEKEIVCFACDKEQTLKSNKNNYKWLTISCESDVVERKYRNTSELKMTNWFC